MVASGILARRTDRLIRSISAATDDLLLALLMRSPLPVAGREAIYDPGRTHIDAEHARNRPGFYRYLTIEIGGCRDGDSGRQSVHGATRREPG